MIFIISFRASSASVITVKVHEEALVVGFHKNISRTVIGFL